MAKSELVARDKMLTPGEIAPDFMLLDQHRQEWTLSDHAGSRGVLLAFFPFAFTGVCTTEMECITAELDRIRSDGLEVVGISCDSFAALNAWAQQVGLKHTLLSDLHREVCKAYGLYWSEMNVAQRGTVIVRREDGQLRVAWSQRREPPQAMDLDQVLAFAG